MVTTVLPPLAEKELWERKASSNESKRWRERKMKFSVLTKQIPENWS